MDLSKEFVKIEKQNGFTTLHFNTPNNSIGDFAFEWDLDGSQRKVWEERMEELKKNGTYGDLSYKKLTVQDNPALDTPMKQDYPLTSYKMIVL